MSEAWREITGSSNVRPISKRGTRWPPGQPVPEEWIEIGYQVREKAKLPRIDIRFEADKFVDEWTSRGDARAVKTNWLGTWRNWCRRAWGKPEEKPTKPGISDIVEQSRARAKLAARGLRAALLDRADLELGVREGILTIEQARRMGL